MAIMLRTLFVEDPSGETVRLTAGEEAPDWYKPNRFVEGFQADGETSSHPADGGATEDPAQMSGDKLVQGSIPVVLERVGDDPALAQEALTAEVDGQKRTTLLEQLQAIVDGAEDDDDTNPEA